MVGWLMRFHNVSAGSSSLQVKGWERRLALCKELSRSQNGAQRRLKKSPAITALAVSRYGPPPPPPDIALYIHSCKMYLSSQILQVFISGCGIFHSLKFNPSLSPVVLCAGVTPRCWQAMPGAECLSGPLTDRWRSCIAPLWILDALHFSFGSAVFAFRENRVSASVPSGRDRRLCLICSYLNRFVSLYNWISINVK